MHAPFAIYGDSITQNWAFQRPQELAQLGVYTNGISGQTIAQIVDRMAGDLVFRQRQKIALFGGTNDIAENGGWYHEDAALATITLGGVLIENAGSSPILCTLPPANYFFWNPSVLPKFKTLALNDRIRELAASRGWALADFYHATADANGVLSEEFTEDGCHLTNLAYAKMEIVLRNSLAN